METRKCLSLPDEICIQNAQLAISLFGLGFIVLNFIWHDRTIDIYIHDTMIVIAKSPFFLAPAFLFLFFWIAYSAGHILIYRSWLTWLHFFLCAISSLIIAGFMLFGAYSSPGRYYMANEIPIICMVLFVFAQFLFLLNMIAGITRKLMFLGSSGK